MNFVYFSIIAILAAGGCEEEVLLIPDRMSGDVYSASYPLSRLLDGNYGSWWRGNSNSEYVTYYYSSRVTVTKVFVQRYYYYATSMQVNDGSRTYTKNFGASSEYYDTVTFPINNVLTNRIWFYFYFNGYPRISRAEVYGCYNTSTPTTVPTSGPTELPTVFPTMSPTLSPITTPPTKAPSIFPTTAPTGSPSIFPTTAPTGSPSIFPTTHPTGSPSIFPTTGPTESPSSDNPSAYPSTAPTLTPTKPPSAIPSTSPSLEPTVIYIDQGFHVTVGKVELFIIVVIFLCGVIFFLFRRYKKVSQVDNYQKNQESEMQTVQSYNIEEAIKRVVTKNGFKRKADMDKTYNEGENFSTENYKRSNHRVGEEKNERMESQVLSDDTVDFRLVLDKVNSEL